MWPVARRVAAALLAMGLVVLLGTAAVAAPSPAPGAPGGTGVIAWSCDPKSTPSPTTTPSPIPLGTTPRPTTVASPFGQECAATEYSEPNQAVVAAAPVVVSSLPPFTVQVSQAPVTVSGWPECFQGQEWLGSPSPTPSPASSPYELRPGSAIGRDCAAASELLRGQAFGLWLFLSALLTLALGGFLLRHGRRFRG